MPVHHRLALFIFNLCVYTCLCVFVCMSVCYPFQLPFILCLCLSLNLELRDLSRLASQKFKDLPVSGSPMLELQAHAAMPRLLNGGAGSELRSSCLHDEYPPDSHPLGPRLFQDYINHTFTSSTASEAKSQQ